MEKKQETKKTKNITQKAKKIRSIIMMTLLCVLMMSAATYAWFTLSKTAKVSNMTMTVGDVTGLQIAADKTAINTGTGASTYGNELKFGENGTDGEKYKITGKLLPATLVPSGTNIQKPKYDEQGSGKVVAVEDVNQDEILKNGSLDTQTGYYYETTFYLKSLGNNLSVKLAEGTGLDGTGIQNGGEGGTYILNSKDQTETGNNSATHIGAKAIRIWLSAIDTEGNSDCGKIIYQSNSDLTTTKTYTQATDGRDNKAAETSTDVQNKDGKFSQQGSLNLVAEHDTKITMRIWIEGTDAFCGNEIKLEDIIAQLQFLGTDTTT